MSTIHLSNELLDVAVLRFQLQQAKDTLTAAQEQFAADHATLIAEIRDLDAQLSIAETKVKTDALMHYAATQEKKPCDGVEVKIFHSLDYAEGDAQGWAEKHPEKGLLTLNRKLYEKLLKVARENELPDWADAPGKLNDAPRAQIASDLTKVFSIDEIAAAGIPLEKSEPES